MHILFHIERICIYEEEGGDMSRVEPEAETSSQHEVASTPDLEQQFAELEKYVVRIDESILDEKQKKE